MKKVQFILFICLLSFYSCKDYTCSCIYYTPPPNESDREEITFIKASSILPGYKTKEDAIKECNEKDVEYSNGSSVRCALY